MPNFIIERHKVASLLKQQTSVLYHLQKHGILIDLETDLAWLLPKALPIEKHYESDFSNLKWNIGPLKKWADATNHIDAFGKKLSDTLFFDLFKDLFPNRQ